MLLSCRRCFNIKGMNAVQHSCAPYLRPMLTALARPQVENMLLLHHERLEGLEARWGSPVGQAPLQ